MSDLRIGSLCSGYGGLTMATEAVLGGSLAWVSDIDKGACKVLAHRFPDVPNIGDEAIAVVRQQAEAALRIMLARATLLEETA